MSVLFHILGLDNGSGHWYLWWSGVGSDITEFAVIGAVWHSVNCHEPGCWRVGRRVTASPDGLHVRQCARHHQQRHMKERTEL
jgi:hypothetical protein